MMPGLERVLPVLAEIIDRHRRGMPYGIFLLLPMASFALHHYGGGLGIAAIIVDRVKEPRSLLGRAIVAEPT